MTPPPIRDIGDIRDIEDIRDIGDIVNIRDIVDVGIGSLIGAIMILDIKSMPPVSISQNYVEEGMTRLQCPPHPIFSKKTETLETLET